MIIDTVNGGGSFEEVDVVLKRLEGQINEKWKEQDILGLAEDIYAVVSNWANLKQRSDDDDPYIHLEHTTDIKRSTARTYFGIGKALGKYGKEIEGQKIDIGKIRSPYMLLYVGKALNCHLPYEVKDALESMTYRQFKDFASQGKDESSKGEAKDEVAKSETETKREDLKARFKEQFDEGKEVYVVAVTRREQWDFICSKLCEWAGVEEQEDENEVASIVIDEIQSPPEAA